MAYATSADLATWLGTTTPPADADLLLAQASRHIDRAVLARVIADNRVHTAALRDATCAQVEQWLLVGRDHVLAGYDPAVQQEAGGIRSTPPATMSPEAVSILQRANLTRPIGG